ncbi:MAG TPA: acyl-CoA dehydrogenase family protein, partial [Nocardioides sp.]
QSLDLGTLACSAQLLGAGRRMLQDTVAYAQQRHQFGKPIGGQQAVKHLLADVRVALDFAAPLVHNASLTLAPRDVSAGKVAAGDAAYLAARTALQVHGAIGYTREFDLSLWILKVRALVGAWGTPAEHRARILESLVEGR